MTIDESIAQTDGLLSNKIPRELKISWLSALDHELYLNVILTHEGAEAYNFSPYSDDADGETELLVKPPYDGLYPEYLKMKINSELYDHGRYNSNMLAFSSMLEEFKAHYNRTNRPLKGEKVRYWR